MLFAPEAEGRVHPCRNSDDCSPGTDVGGAYVRDDSVLRMYKYIEARVMTRCPGSSAPAEPGGYSWNDSEVLTNFRGAPDREYCPVDPYITCGG